MMMIMLSSSKAMRKRAASGQLSTGRMRAHCGQYPLTYPALFRSSGGTLAYLDLYWVYARESAAGVCASQVANVTRRRLTRISNDRAGPSATR